MSRKKNVVRAIEEESMHTVDLTTPVVCVIGEEEETVRQLRQVRQSLIASIGPVPEGSALSITGRFTCDPTLAWRLEYRFFHSNPSHVSYLATLTTLTKTLESVAA